MNKSLRSPRHGSGRKLLTSGILICWLTLTSTTRANYVPPSDASAPTSAPTITGRRGGCCGNEITNLTALAPHSHVGQTISTHPTFSWYVPDSESLPMEFHLEEYNDQGDRHRIQKIELQSTPGIMSLSLPETLPGLEVGRRYRWQVVLLCRPNYPSRALVAGAEIELVETPSTLKTGLATVHDRTQRAHLFTESGFWYDAFAELQGANNSQVALLEDLSSLENATGQHTQSTQLQQIIELERRQSARSTYNQFPINVNGAQ